MASPTSVIRTEHARDDGRLLLVVDLRVIAGIAAGLVLIAAPLLAAPLGRLGSPFAMLLVLPPLALALEAFGWRDRLAGQLAAIREPLPRLLVAYAVWLATSSLLTLDVAAVAAASVGVAVAGDRATEKRWQLGAAILGANVGSLLFPFSNLTNLVLVGASGIGLGVYTAVAAGPALAAALAVGLLLAVRSRRRLRDPSSPTRVVAAAGGLSSGSVDTGAALAGGVVLLGAIGAIAAGLVGADIAVPFAVSAGILAGAAVGGGRLGVRAIARSVPVAGLGVIALAALASGPIGAAAGSLPRPDASGAGLLVAVAVGGVLAAVVNNLPAAAFGAAWLEGAHPASVVAYLLGTNIVALATPHGSVATILSRDVARRQGVAVPTRRHLQAAWLYALAGAGAGLLALALLAH